MNVTLTSTCTCAACGQTAAAVSPSGLHAPALVPALPAGWTEVGRLLYCPQHLIVVCVDGIPWACLRAPAEQRTP